MRSGVHGGLHTSSGSTVSTPGSASYRHFLTAAQYQATYAPTTADVSAVRTWLTGAGLHVDGVAPGNRYVSVSGTVGGAEKAFGAQIGRYVHNGTTVQAPTSALTVPASFSFSCSVSLAEYRRVPAALIATQLGLVACS